MGRRLQMLIALIVGAGVGFLLGGAWLSPLNEPPARPHIAADGGSGAGLAGPATPTDAALADLLAGRMVKRRAIPADPSSGTLAEDDPAVLVPSQVAEAQPVEEDASLVARGPGHFAILDLAAAGVGGLHIRAGAMERDGGGRFGPWANKPKVGRLRGRHVRVELLHLGFDSEGRPTVAHIRTAQEPFVEGVVSLLHDERYVPVRPDRSQPAAAPSSEGTRPNPAPDAS